MDPNHSSVTRLMFNALGLPGDQTDRQTVTEDTHSPSVSIHIYTSTYTQIHSSVDLSIYLYFLHITWSSLDGIIRRSVSVSGVVFFSWWDTGEWRVCPTNGHSTVGIRPWKGFKGWIYYVGIRLSLSLLLSFSSSTPLYGLPSSGLSLLGFYSSWKQLDREYMMHSIKCHTVINIHPRLF